MNVQMTNLNRPGLWVLLVLLLGVTMPKAHAQTSSLTIEASQNVTNFIFFNSAQERDKGYSPAYSGGYALGYKYAMDMGLFFTGKLGMRRAGATYVFDQINYAWDLQYAEVRLGVGYNYSFGKLGAHLSAQPYFGYMLQANQRLDDQDFDIRDTGVLETTDFGVFVSPGANFTVSEYIGVYLDLNYMFGLSNLETEADQVSRNSLFGGTLGVAFTIK